MGTFVIECRSFPNSCGLVGGYFIMCLLTVEVPWKFSFSKLYVGKARKDQTSDLSPLAELHNALAVFFEILIVLWKTLFLDITILIQIVTFSLLKLIFARISLNFRNDLRVIITVWYIREDHGLIYSHMIYVSWFWQPCQGSYMDNLFVTTYAVPLDLIMYIAGWILLLSLWVRGEGLCKLLGSY